MRLKDLAERIGATLIGSEDPEITSAAGILEAGPGQIAYTDAGRLKDLDRTKAAAVIVPLDTPDRNFPLLRAKNPRLAFARALEVLYARQTPATGISDRAVVGKAAMIGKDVLVHPFAVIDENVRIGDHVTLYPGVYIGRESIIGNDTVIHANVSIGNRIAIGSRVIIHAGTVIGSDGFGFVTDGGIHHKIPQVGGVIVEDDVEIGGNCTIDRATLGNTIIKKGTKLDNQVHVAHNVTIGEHCLIAGQVGIAGSSTLGNYVAFGGQVGVADHTVVGDRVMAGGKTVITKDVAPGSVIAGNYAMPIRDWLRIQAVLPRLPEIRKLISDLERRLKAVEERHHE